jgi:thiamine-phosphate pyrophosphorylase
MNRRHKNKRPYPRVWLMTDPRFDDALLAAVQRLPSRSGIIFRHYNLDVQARHALFLAVKRICARRGHTLLLAGTEQQAHKWNADGFHNRTAPRTRSKGLLRTAPVHSAQEIAWAKRIKADLLFLSPMFATTSHKGERPLGRYRFMALASACQATPVIALGGLNKQQGQGLNARRIHGWAGIDAFRSVSRWIK